MMTWSGVRTRLERYAIVVVLAVLFVSLSITSSTFLTQQNLVNVLDQVAPAGILTCAATLCIISGVFDLSMSAVMALSGITAVMIAQHVGTPVAWVGALVVGALLGAANGLINYYGKVNSFIATLATSIVMRGLAIVVTGGIIVQVQTGGFEILGTSTPIANVSGATWLFLGVALVTGFLLAKTSFGRAVYAIGDNTEAARLSGIRVGTVRISVFAISGLCAALAGLIYASRTQSASPSMAVGLELTAIASTVVGGTSILGGEGAVWRGLLGALVLALIGNGMNLLAINATYQLVAQGALILIAVMVDQLLRRRH